MNKDKNNDNIYGKKKVTIEEMDELLRQGIIIDESLIIDDSETTTENESGKKKKIIR